KSGARELGSTGPGSAAPERDRLGEVAALVGGLVRIQVRVVRLQEAAPARHELARRTLVRQAEQAEEPLRLVGARLVGRAPAAPGRPRVDGLADPRMEPPEERSCVGCLLCRHQPAPAREREMASPGALVNGDLLQASGAPGGAEVAVARRGEYAPERHESASA